MRSIHEAPTKIIQNLSRILNAIHSKILTRMSLSSEDLNLVMKFLCQDFGGDWLLLGGSLIRFNVGSSRGTTIDLQDVEAAKNKWGMTDFNRKQFLEWAGDRELAFAKNLGLLE